MSAQDNDEYIEVEWEVETILAERFNEPKCQYEYLVKWKNWAGDTWEPEEAFGKAKGLLLKWKRYQEAVTWRQNEDRCKEFRILQRKWLRVQDSTFHFEGCMRRRLRKYENRGEILRREIQKMTLLKAKLARMLERKNLKHEKLSRQKQSLEEALRGDKAVKMKHQLDEKIRKMEELKRKNSVMMMEQAQETKEPLIMGGGTTNDAGTEFLALVLGEQISSDQFDEKIAAAKERILEMKANEKHKLFYENLKNVLNRHHEDIEEDNSTN